MMCTQPGSSGERCEMECLEAAKSFLPLAVMLSDYCL